MPLIDLTTINKSKYEDFICPITQNLIVYPVSIEGDESGQLYEYEAIEKHFKVSNLVPYTNLPAKSINIKIDTFAQKKIKTFLREYNICTFDEFYNAVKADDISKLQMLYYVDSYLSVTHLTTRKPVLYEAIENASDHDNEGKVLVLLLKEGADPNVKDTFGYSSLHMVIDGNYINEDDIIKLLLEHGARLEEKNDDGKTPLHIAVENDKEQIVKFLLSVGAKIDVKDNEGYTLLHSAAELEYPTILEILLNKITDLNVRDNKDCTPLHCAARKGNTYLAKFLLKKGANEQMVNLSNRTPAQEARIHLHEETAKFIEEFFHKYTADLSEIIEQQKRIIQQQHDRIFQLEDQLSNISHRLNISDTTNDISKSSTAPQFWRTCSK